MKYLTFFAVIILCGLGLNTAMAMDKDMQHGKTSPHKAEYMRSMEGMHKNMMEGVMDSDPDTAFVRGMLPHHQGAVDMARIELKYGKDPELRKLAQDIINAQEKEIKFMNEWLKKKSAQNQIMKAGYQSNCPALPCYAG